MDQSLESYIKTNATLQAAFVQAEFRSDPSKRYYNFEHTSNTSDDFKAVSQRYLCQDEDDQKGHDPIKNKANTTHFIPDGMYRDLPPIDSFTKLTPFEEAYLALDETDDEEFEKWYGQLNNGLQEQPISNTTNERSDVDVNDNSKETYVDSTDSNKESFCTVGEHLNSNTTTSFNSQPGLPGIEPKMNKSQSQRYANGKFQNNHQTRNPFKTPRNNNNNRMNRKRRNTRWSNGDVRSDYDNSTYKNRTNNAGFGFVNDNNKGILPNRQQMTMHNGSTINVPANSAPTFNCGSIPPNTSVCNNAAFQNMRCNGYGEMNIPVNAGAGAGTSNIQQTPLQANFSGNYCQNCCGCSCSSRNNILNNGAKILNELLNLSASYQLGSQVDDILNLI